ncbi:MAG TPA: hypothetical protein H9672_05560 [Firmicutes bacterium]|nr:hypothetical protein [Bacillota bacterium]
MKKMKVRLTFAEEVLGSLSSDPEIHEEFIASKAPDAKTREEEVEELGVDEVVEKSKTIFPKDAEGNPFLYDYQIKGFFKSAAKAYNYIKKGTLPAYKGKIDQLVFINERKIPFHMPEGSDIGSCQRPLRAQTAQGERVALANSETCSEGTWIEFTIMVLVDDLAKNVESWLDYGLLNGIGQWRNSGKGRFTWEKVYDWTETFIGDLNDGDGDKEEVDAKKGRKVKKDVA